MTKMTKMTFTPTDKRGAELAREILNQIEVEVARSRKSRRSVTTPSSASNAWDQSQWAALHTEKVNGMVGEVQKKTVDGHRKRLAVLPPGAHCGTAMCFAGHAAAAVGDRFAYPFDPWWNPQLAGKTELRGEDFRSLGQRLLIDLVITADTGRTVLVRDRARKLLGLTEHEGEILFDWTNTLEDLRRYVTMMEQGRSLATGRPKKNAATS